jgi:hypothetical protein
MWLKNKNTIIKNKKMRCARQMWKHIFICQHMQTWTWKEHNKAMVQNCALN